MAADGDADMGLEEEMVRPARVAAAVVLLLGAKDWLASHEGVRDRAQAIVNAAIEETSLERDRSRFHYSTAPSYLEFVAFLVFHDWLSVPSADNDSALLRVLLSGDDRAAGVIADMAYAHRAALGDRWWRLQYLALLWSGLIILKPRFGREDGRNIAVGCGVRVGYSRAGYRVYLAPSMTSVPSMWLSGSRSLRPANGRKNIAMTAEPSPEIHPAGCLARWKRVSSRSRLRGC